jgi:hypothetical protein
MELIGKEKIEKEAAEDGALERVLRKQPLNCVDGFVVVRVIKCREKEKVE